MLAHIQNFQSLFGRSKRDAFWGNEDKIDEKGCMKEFLCKLASWHLTISLQNNFFTDSFQGFNPLSTKSTKWPNTLKQFVGKLPTNCLSVFGHFVNLALKGLRSLYGKTSRTVALSIIEKFFIHFRALVSKIPYLYVTCRI